MQGASTAQMAWRNIWRNKRRTLVTLFGISFGTLLAVLFTGIGDSNYTKMINLAARLGNGHVTFQNPEYQELPSLKRTVRVNDEMNDRILADENVTRTTVRITGQAMFATASQNLGGFFIAIDPAKEDEKTLSVYNTISEGKMLESSTDKGIILGAKLAENLNAGLGRKVVYTLTNKSGDIVSELARVKGIVKTGSPSVDGGLVLLAIDRIREVAGYEMDEATQVAVYIDDQRRSAEVAARLKPLAGKDRAVLTWKETQAELAGFISMKVVGSLIMEILILILVAAGIFNTLFVSVMERMREFGIMAALGFSSKRLFGLVMWESLMLGIAGLIASAILTSWPYYYLATTGIDLSEKVGEGIEVSGVGMSKIIYIGLYPENGVIIAVVVLLATLVSGLYPAWRAGRVVPVESIKLV
jgi:ABC-type lipoprotein release transport system permease subunit